MIDHLVYAVPDLEKAMEDFSEKLGLKPQIGGQHPHKGTWNALFSLGKEAYFELIATDPKQAPPVTPRWMGVDFIERPQLLRWACKSRDIVADKAKAEALGFPLGKIEEGSRQLPDGSWLKWRLTDPGSQAGVGVVPFLLDWGTSVHPSQNLAGGCELVALEVEHPEPDRLQGLYDALGIPLRVSYRATPGLRARIDSPRGLFEI
jgi:catechol 2,3-dioxygenase-like lactoylglutathione lyase family enzyme